MLLALPLTLSTLLLVLFAVVVNRQQQQALQLAELQQRVQALEQSRALERTTVLEEQMRTMLTRLQTLEKGGALLQTLERQQEQLQRELQLVKASQSGPGGGMDPGIEPMPANRPSRAGSNGPRQPGAGIAPPPAPPAP